MGKITLQDIEDAGLRFSNADNVDEWDLSVEDLGYIKHVELTSDDLEIAEEVGLTPDDIRLDKYLMPDVDKLRAYREAVLSDPQLVLDILFRPQTPRQLSS